MWGSKWWAICFEESIFSPDFPDSNKCGEFNSNIVLGNIRFN